jgi:hypothetical protein
MEATRMKAQRRWKKLLFPLAILSALAACASLPQGGAQNDLCDQLYFGLSKSSGMVSPGEWGKFVEEVIAPAFPKGYSIWQAEGQWEDAGGQVEREPSEVLEVVHPPDPTFEKRIQTVIESYKGRFQQESVMRLQSEVKADF